MERKERVNLGPDPSSQLERRVGLFPAALMGVGVILGAGIYVIIGAAAGKAGTGLWLSFLIAAAGATLTAVSYARLTRLRPRNAPEYQFLNMAFGELPGFLAGWLVLWSVVISAAAVALGFAGYLEHLFGVPVLVGAIGLIAISSVVIFVGVRESVIIAGILTAIEAGGLILIIGIGTPYLGSVDLLELPAGISGVVAGASLVFFAYLGFEGMANFSEEMKDPGRDLPKAIMFALGASTVLYILVALAVVSVTGWAPLSQSGAPLALVAGTVLGTRGDVLLTGIALASTANTVILLLFGASRAMWALSTARLLPSVFHRVHSKRRTPWAAVLAIGLATIAFASTSNLEQVAQFTNFAILLAFVGVNASLIKIFRRNTASKSPKEIVLNMLLPGLGLATAAFLATYAGGQAALLGAALLLGGALAYTILKFFRDKRGK